jgi:uncharacterized protein (DUF427 family)
MPRALWHDTVIAASNDTVVVEGNHYFPEASVNSAHLRPSATHTVCGWKGTASYYDVVVGDAVNKDAAWYYPTPKDAAKQIDGRIAFWKGVKVEA